MTIKETLENFKEIQVLTLNFIEKEDEIEGNFQNLKSKIDKQKICDNLYSFTLFLHLIAKISDNHFHETDFYSKIEKILLSFKDEIKGKYPDSEIFSIFKNNKKILLFLLEEKILEINNYIATKIQSGKYKKEKYPQYFFPEIKPYIKVQKEKKDTYANDLQNVTKMFYPKDDFMALMFMHGVLQNRMKDNKDDIKKDEDSWISEFSNKLPDYFYENRKNGENENKICYLIRNDLIDNFITYVEKEGYKLDSTIPLSNYETNPFLLKNPKTTLIEYATFFGSNQIFKYLFKNGVKLTQSLWKYAVHSNNPEIIHLLEENDVKLESYSQILNESIKCHHNEVANYIINNYLDKEENDSFTSSLKSYNFAFLQEDLIDNRSFFNLCRYDYCLFVGQLIKQKNIDVNEAIENDIEYGYHHTYTETKTILHVAIEKGNINMIKLLLTNENIDVNSKKKYVTQSPHPNRHTDFVNFFKGNEWDPWDEWTDYNNDIFVEISPLYLAIENDNIDIIKILLENKNLDVNSLSKFWMESPEENYKLMSPLHEAVEKENLEIIQILLENESIDANVISIELYNDPDGNGKKIKRRERTALAMAVENESIETVKLLISSEKVDPNLPRTYFSYRDEHEEWSSEIDEKERPPLHIAIHKNNIEIFKLLLNSEKIDINILQIELKSEIWVDDSEEWDERRADYDNPTFETSYLWGDIPKKWISTLREKKNQKSPLFFAIESNNNKIVQILLENEKIDVNLRNKLVDTNISKDDKKNTNKVEEKTALNFAIENENINAVNILLKTGKINIDFPSKLSIKPKEFEEDEEEEKEEKEQNVQGEEKEITPLQIATEKGNAQIINLIKSYKK